MEDGPPEFTQGSTCPALLGCSAKRPITFNYGAITLYRQPFQTVRLAIGFVTLRPVKDPVTLNPTTPVVQRSSAWHTAGLGCSPFARRYSGNHGCFLFLEVLRWFTSLGSLHTSYFIQRWVTRHYPCWVSPFGNLRIEVCLRLTEAFRSLLRPSSPLDAKASTVRS